MEYKITSREDNKPMPLMHVAPMLICNGISFRYDYCDKAIYADISESDAIIFGGINDAIAERVEPTQAEVDELNQELYDLLDKTKDGYIELSESIYARAEEDCIDYSTRIMMVDVDAVTIDNYSLVFNFGSDYISAGYFSKADQIKVYEQAIKDVKSYLDNER